MRLNQRFFTIVLCINILSVSYLFSAPVLSSFKTQKTDLSWVDETSKNDNSSTKSRVDVTASEGLAIDQEPFDVESDTLALWHFDEDSLQIIFQDAKASYPLSKVATITPGSSTARAYFNNAIEYVGNGGVSHATILDTGMIEGTIEFWIKPKNDNPTNQYIIYKGLESARDVVTLYFDNNGKLQWRNDYGSGIDFLTTNTNTWSKDLWYYIAITLDSQYKRIYVNGVLDNSVNQNGQIVASTSQDFIIGRYPPNTLQDFDGLIDEVRISTTCHSEYKIFSNYGRNGYRYSSDSGSTWTSWTNLDAGSASHGTTSVQTLTSSAINFTKSSLVEDKINIIVSNTDYEYTVSTYTVLVDTVTPTSIVSFESYTTTDSYKVKLSWKAPFDFPDDGANNGKVSSYSIKYSTSDLSVYSSDKDLWWTNASDLSGEPIPLSSGTVQSEYFTLPESEVKYYFAMKSYDDLYWSGFDYKAQTNVLASTDTGGVHKPYNFQGSALSNSSINWSWNDYSVIEISYTIHNAVDDSLIASLSPNTTYYEETGLSSSTSYNRYVYSHDEYGNKTKSDVKTVSTQSNGGSTIEYKDIDGDGIDEEFNVSQNTYSGGSTTAILIADAVLNGKKDVFIDINGDSKPDYLWQPEDDIVTDVYLDDVDSDGSVDYVYGSVSNIVLDYYYDSTYGGCKHIGYLTGQVHSGDGSYIDSAIVTVVSDSGTVNAISDDQGDFVILLPIMHGKDVDISISKQGYALYKNSSLLKQGQNNVLSLNILATNLAQDRDDIHNYPNPVNKGGDTTFVYGLIEDADVLINIYNTKGIVVKRLVDEWKVKGEYSIDWDLRDSGGRILSRDLYYVIMKTNKSKVLKKIVVR